jgi:hypothetical protein
VPQARPRLANGGALARPGSPKRHLMLPAAVAAMVVGGNSLPLLTGAHTRVPLRAVLRLAHDPATLLPDPSYAKPYTTGHPNRCPTPPAPPTQHSRPSPVPGFTRQPLSCWLWTQATPGPQLRAPYQGLASAALNRPRRKCLQELG